MNWLCRSINWCTVRHNSNLNEKKQDDVQSLYCTPYCLQYIDSNEIIMNRTAIYGCLLSSPDKFIVIVVIVVVVVVEVRDVAVLVLKCFVSYCLIIVRWVLKIKAGRKNLQVVSLFYLPTATTSPKVGCCTRSVLLIMKKYHILFFLYTWISRETRDPHSDDPKFPIKHSIGDVIYLPVDTTKESKSKREKEERGHFFSLIYSIQNMYLERYRYNNNPPPPPPHSSHWQTAWPSRYCSGLLVVSLFPFNNNTTTSNWELEQK